MLNIKIENMPFTRIAFIRQTGPYGQNNVKIMEELKAIQKAWLEIFSELSGHNYQMDGTRPILERYKTSLVKEHYCEICVPVD